MSSPPMQSNARSRAKKSAKRNDKRAFETLTALVASWPERGERSAIVEFTRNGSATLSYEELTDRVTRLAHGLRACGVGRGDRVALHGPNSSEWIVSYFAIVTAGAVAVP